MKLLRLIPFLLMLLMAILMAWQIGRPKLGFEAASRTWIAYVGRFNGLFGGHDLTQAILHAKSALEAKRTNGVSLRLHFPSGDWCYDGRIEPVNLQADCNLPFGLRDTNKYQPYEWPKK